MSDTKTAARGLWPTTPATSRVGVRVVSLAMAALIGAVLIVGVTRTAWQRVDRLEQEFSTLRPESFYAGVQMQNKVRRLNDSLLRYRSQPDKKSEIALQARLAFQQEAKELKDWFTAETGEFMSTEERDGLEQIRTAYRDYQDNSQSILDPRAGLLEGLFQTTAGAFHESYTALDRQSTNLLQLCETFVSMQRSNFSQFVARSSATLDGFQRLLNLSVALVLGLGAVLVGLAYRDMIAPLRHQLSESQAIIEQQEKLASLGVLSAGLAHEIRNPLTAIRFRLFSLNKNLSSRETAEDAAVISSEISRLERILEDFLRFARPAEPDLVGIPAQRLLQEVFDLMHEEVQERGITCTLEPSEPLWVKVDTAQLKQVLINLVKNAAESMAHEGTLTLRARLEKPGAASRHPCVALEVSDTGQGIPADVQKRLFDPFFTTKEGGTGLGLPIAARIVEKHGGAIRYRTQAEQGTTFRVVLPQYQDHESQRSAD